LTYFKKNTHSGNRGAESNVLRFNGTIGKRRESMITEQNVREALKECYDPEIPLNVLDLGLIYNIRLDNNAIEIDMTLTAPGCPMHTMISKGIEEKVRQIDGVNDVKVNVIWDPPWTPERISEEGKKILGYEN
jgi:metal-sulfur cluster biosynthetic enzyme